MSSYAMLSFSSVHDTHHTHILWIPKPRVVLTTVLCDTLQLYCSSSCFDNCVLHMHLVWCACCYGLPLWFACCYGLPLWCACCYGLPLYHHIICINCDQLTMDFCCRLIPCIQKLNYHLIFMLRMPYQLSRLV